VTFLGGPTTAAQATVWGSGLPGEPPLVTPLAADFGRVPPGQTSVVHIFKVSRAPAVGDPVVATNAEEFAIVSNDCATAAARGELTCNVGVQFAPTEARPYAANLEVRYASAGRARASLSGTASVESGAFLDATGATLSTFDFSAPPPGAPAGATRADYGTKVGARSRETTVFLRNSGTAPTGALMTGIAGLHPDDFGIASNTCTRPLGPGEQCAVTLVFVPTATGEREGTLVVTVAGGGSASLLVRGVALPAGP
jgi:hypothetical protein